MKTILECRLVKIWDKTEFLYQFVLISFVVLSILQSHSNLAVQRLVSGIIETPNLIQSPFLL